MQRKLLETLQNEGECLWSEKLYNFRANVINIYSGHEKIKIYFPMGIMFNGCRSLRFGTIFSFH